MPIKSFRGKLEHGTAGIEQINLHTNDGRVGYRVKKMELLGVDLTGRDQESVFKV